MARDKDLAQIIRDNPGCIAVIDNDSWRLYKKREGERSELEELVRDEDVIPRGSGYGSGCYYGGDVLQALASIVGITVISA